MPTLADAMLDSLMKSSAEKGALTKAALVVFGTLLLAISAQFKIPLYPVPITGQTLPLISMGGTSIVFTCISIGIVLSISRDSTDRDYEKA